MGRKHGHPQPQRRGFSLIEVLIALVVVVFALYGVLDLVAANQQISLRARRRAVATELARAKMAEIRTAGFGAVTALWDKATSGPSQSFIYPSDPAEFKAPYRAGPFRWQARYSRNPRQPDAINVEVRVLWYPTTKGAPEEVLANSVSVGELLVKK